MSDLRVSHADSATERTLAVSRDGGAPQHGGGDASSHQDGRRTGAEELAVALSASDRGATLTAHFEVGNAGEALIRIIDRARNETVALVTPEELKALAEDTGLPPGLLVQVSS
jgi:hypothetical protein